MKSVALAALATAVYAGAAVPASKVCVTNVGGYDLDWWLDDLISGNESNNSGNYPIDQTRC